MAQLIVSSYPLPFPMLHPRGIDHNRNTHSCYAETPLMVGDHTSYSATYWQKSGGIDQASSLLSQSDYITKSVIL